MKILIVCSGTKGILSPFIKEQMDSLSLEDVDLLLFQIKKRGILGYLLHLPKLLATIRQYKPDLIHAHYGLSGLLANMQRKIPVIITFHGSDVNNSKILKWSKLALMLSAASIFVEEKMLLKFKKHHNSFIIPCGVDVTKFYPISKSESCKKLSLPEGTLNILFSSGFDNPGKNYPLARLACDLVEKSTGRHVNLMELKGLSREMVNLYINASDCVLLYSSSEGSPQFIKEAMACNSTIVATDVGDVSWIIGETEGCFITSMNVDEVADKIVKAVNFSVTKGPTRGRDRILSLGLDTFSIVQRVMKTYKTLPEFGTFKNRI